MNTSHFNGFFYWILKCQNKIDKLAKNTGIINDRKHCLNILI